VTLSPAAVQGALGDRPQTSARLPDPRHRKTAAPQHGLECRQATPGHAAGPGTEGVQGGYILGGAG